MVVFIVTCQSERTPVFAQCARASAAPVPMMCPLLSLHHVTATADRAQPDLDFCLDALGLRLVKKTVNFDNHHVYHFYYGDERGTPGTIWTTFPYHGHGVRLGTKGAGQVTATSFSVPASSLAFWRSRLTAHRLSVESGDSRFGEETLHVTDPSGLAMELVGTAADRRAPWVDGGLSGDAAIRGLHSVTLAIRSPRETIDFLTGVLGCHVAGEAGPRTRVCVGSDAPGHWLDILHAPDAPPAVNGLGTVHHVALAIANPDDQPRLREDLLARGCKVTDVKDRQYFKSIYFREPGGVLIEVATMKPGFDVDEALASLGRDLKLPPWEEPHRAEIEAGLPRITYRGSP
jgi:glyoxalase family protein